MQDISAGTPFFGTPSGSWQDFVLHPLRISGLGFGFSSLRDTPNPGSVLLHLLSQRPFAREFTAQRECDRFS
jgi:hypothetical protein